MVLVEPTVKPKVDATMRDNSAWALPTPARMI